VTPSRTLQQAYAQGHMVVLGVGVSYERGTAVPPKPETRN